MLLQKGDKIEIEIEKIVYGGEGLGYHSDMAIFVPMSVPGDKLLVEVISVKKSYARALIVDILEAGEERVDSTRKSFEDFQGCDFAMLRYESQLKYKKMMVEDVLRRIGKIENIEILDIIPSPDIYNYRNKVIEPFGKVNGKIITGFFKRKTHNIFEVEENMLNSKLGNRIIEKFKEIANKENISVYDEKTHRGILRNIMVRTTSLDKAMVVLIINDETVPEAIKNILYRLKEEIVEIVSIYVSLNNKKTNVVLGNKNILVAGDKDLKEDLNGIEFNISPTSFFQINKKQTENLYRYALEMFDNLDDKIIVDGYAGTGTIGMMTSKKAKYVYSIEIVESAIRDGRKTAKENGIKNMEFICGDITKELKKLISRKQIDAIIFDPPRKGIEEDILKEISKIGLKEIVYISCNPATFARDIEILNRCGYSLDRVQPVDMFPQTSHIEIIGKLIKKEG